MCLLLTLLVLAPAAARPVWVADDDRLEIHSPMKSSPGGDVALIQAAHAAPATTDAPGPVAPLQDARRRLGDVQVSPDLHNGMTLYAFGSRFGTCWRVTLGSSVGRDSSSSASECNEAGFTNDLGPYGIGFLPGTTYQGTDQTTERQSFTGLDYQCLSSQVSIL